jgi:hypothetical protein
MMHRKNRLFTRITATLVVSLTAIFCIANTAMASQITGRQVVIGSPVALASTTYAFTFTVPTATAIKSASFTACTTASGACTPAPGFSASSSSLTSQPTNLGAASGWTVSTATANSLRLSDASNSTAPSGSQTVSFSAVTNPTATNSTFFLRIATFSGSDWATGPLDTGTVAASTGGQVTVNASVDEALTFTIAAQNVGLGTITTSTTGTGTSSMSASSNAAHGYNITYSGTTLTDGSHPFGAMAGVTPTQGVNQFGLNLALNSSPAVAGSATPSGGSGTAATGYGTANTYKFNSTDPVATASGASNTTTYTTSYLANVDAATPAGAYSTVLSYVATPNF